MGPFTNLSASKMHPSPTFVAEAVIKTCRAAIQAVRRNQINW
jgi:hypothetical protein